MTIISAFWARLHRYVLLTNMLVLKLIHLYPIRILVEHRPRNGGGMSLLPCDRSSLEESRMPGGTAVLTIWFRGFVRRQTEDDKEKFRLDDVNRDVGSVMNLGVRRPSENAN
jgi:hypothetical protein